MIASERKTGILRRFVLAAVLVVLSLAAATAAADVLLLPADLAEIGEEAFMGDTSLNEVIVPDGTLSIGDYAFAGSSLSRVHLPGSLVSIGEHAFEGCGDLTVFAPSGSEALDFARENGFQSMAELVPGREEQIDISGYEDSVIFSFIPAENGIYRFESPESGSPLHATLLDENMEAVMSDYGSEEYPLSLECKLTAGTQYYYSVGCWYSAGSFKVRFTASTTWIVSGDGDEVIIRADGEMKDRGYSTFWPTTIKRAVIREGATSISASAFSSCNELTEVVIPDTVTAIRQYAFLDCSSLRAVTLPASVTFIGTGAFSGSSPAVTFLGDAPEFDGDIFSPGSSWRGSTSVLAVYPHGNSTWNKKTKKNYGADCVIWRADNAQDVLPDTEKDETETLTVTGTYTAGSQNYDTYGENVRTSLIPMEDGGWTRVEQTGSGVLVEQYSSKKALVWKKTLPMELPLWGGFYAGENYNFLVFGQSNSEEDDSKEVLRVVRYSKNWHRIDKVSVCGANTTLPFRAGSCRITESGNILYIHTCHQMYTSTDGLRHQANMHFDIYVPTMTIVQQNYLVSNPGNDYVSHSFNQFVATDGNDVIKVDHGDAYPRSVTLLRFDNSADSLTNKWGNRITLLSIAGDIGANYTGVSVGGLAASSSHYLVAVNSIEQGSGGSRRDIYVLAASKENFTDEGVSAIRITNGAQSVSTPVLVKISSSRFLLLWTQGGGTVNYCFLNASGSRASAIYTSEARLSDCQPVVKDNKVTWYVTSGSSPVFYTIDLKNPGSISSN